MLGFYSRLFTESLKRKPRIGSNRFSLTLSMANIALKGISKVGPCLPLTLYMVDTTLTGTQRLGPCHSSEFFLCFYISRDGHRPKTNS